MNEAESKRRLAYKDLQSAKESFQAADAGLNAAKEALRLAREAQEKARLEYEAGQTTELWDATQEADSNVDRCFVDVDVASSKHTAASQNLDDCRNEIARSEREYYRSLLEWPAFRAEIEPLAENVLAAKKVLKRASDTFSKAIADAIAKRDTAIAEATKHHAASGDPFELSLDTFSDNIARLIVCQKLNAIDDKGANASIDQDFLDLLQGHKPPGNPRIAQIGHVAFETERKELDRAEQERGRAYWEQKKLEERERGMAACKSQINLAEERAAAMVRDPTDVHALKAARMQANVGYLKSRHVALYGVPFLEDSNEAFRGTEG